MKLGRALAVLVAGSLAVACQTSPRPVYHVEQARSYARARMRSGTRSCASSRPTTFGRPGPTAPAGTILAERTDYQDAGWAECEIGWVIDNTSNSGGAAARARSIAIWSGDRGRGERRERPRDVEARFEEEQIDPFRNLPFDQPCRSKGVLESALLNALGGAAGAPAAATGGG